jgi:phosphoglycolate phosphatase-like HAD superfamily hydrolase
VGDTPFDAKAALGAGVSPIGVVGGVYGEAELRAAGCRAVYRDLEDLLRRVDQSPLAGAR